MNDITYIGLDVQSCAKWLLGLASIGVASTSATKPVLADMDFTVC